MRSCCESEGSFPGVSAVKEVMPNAFWVLCRVLCQESGAAVEHKESKNVRVRVLNIRMCSTVEGLP